MRATFCPVLPKCSVRSGEVYSAKQRSSKRKISIAQIEKADCQAEGVVGQGWRRIKMPPKRRSARTVVTQLLDLAPSDQSAI
jgi:hypothetical protein